MSAEDEMRREFVRLEAMSMEFFVAVAIEAHHGIQFGSEITGAPGQPVDLDHLRPSWQLSFPTPTLAAIDTNVAYAEAVEDGVGPHGPVVYGAKNGIGGSHSVALTEAGMPRIVAVVTERVIAGQGFTNERSGFSGEDGG